MIEEAMTLKIDQDKLSNQNNRMKNINNYSLNFSSCKDKMYVLFLFSKVLKIS